MAGARARVAVIVAVALLIGGGLGALAAPRPVAAGFGCPNCAQLYVNVQGKGIGTVTDGDGNSCLYSGGGFTECKFSYQWSSVFPSIQVTLTATPIVTSVACNLQGTSGCAAYGTPATQSWTLYNNESPSPSFEFDAAHVAYLAVNLTGSGDGSVVDTDHPDVTCTYANGSESGTCIHDYFWDPSIPSISLLFLILAAPGSGLCPISACVKPIPAYNVSETVFDGVSVTLDFDFVALAPPLPTASPLPTAPPPATAPPSPRPAARTPSPTSVASAAVSPAAPGATLASPAATASGQPTGSPTVAVTAGAVASGGPSIALVIGLLGIAVVAAALAVLELRRSRAR